MADQRSTAWASARTQRRNAIEIKQALAALSGFQAQISNQSVGQTGQYRRIGGPAILRNSSERTGFTALKAAHFRESTHDGIGDASQCFQTVVMQ